MPTIEAHITAVQKDESTGWYRITTDHGEIKRLDTKLEPKARQAAELKRAGSLASIQFTSNPRTLEDGRVFQNYYLDNAEIAKNGSAQQDDGIERVVTSRATAPADAWRITLA